MALNLPESIQLLGHTIHITTEEARRLPDAAGAYTPDTRTIWLDYNHPDPVMVSTLFHELLHAVLDITGHSARLDADTEEALVTAIENGLGPLVGLRGVDIKDTKRPKKA